MHLRRQEVRLSEGAVIVVVNFMMITAGIAVLWIAVAYRRRLREMEHRERLAMIERGLIPSPEADPAEFERRMGIGPRGESPSSVRFRTAGILMFGFGLALMLLITFTANVPRIGLGVGGAFAVLGAAFFLNSMLGGLHHQPAPSASSTSMPRTPDQREPPTNVAP